MVTSVAAVCLHLGAGWTTAENAPAGRATSFASAVWQLQENDPAINTLNSIFQCVLMDACSADLA